MNPKWCFLIFHLSFLILFNRALAAGEGDIDTLKMNLQHDNQDIRIFTVEELGKIRNDEAIAMLIKVIEDKSENWKIRKRAVQILSDAKNYRAVDLLIRILIDSSFTTDCPALKWNAAIALGNFKEHPNVFDALIKSMNDPTLYIREAVIQSLGDIGDKRALPYLISNLNNKSFAIRISAIQAIGKIGDIEAIPFLKQIADSDIDEYIRAEALKTLQTLSEKKH